MSTVYAIITKKLSFEPNDYSILAWQTPGWDDDGYFFTGEYWFRKILSESPQNNDWPHRFAFQSEKAARDFMKNRKDLTHWDCEVMRIKL